MLGDSPSVAVLPCHRAHGSLNCDSPGDFDAFHALVLAGAVVDGLKFQEVAEVSYEVDPALAARSGRVVASVAAIDRPCVRRGPERALL